MQKIIKLSLLLFLLLWQFNAFSQYSGLPTSTQNKINRLNNKINRSFRKFNAFSQKDTSAQPFIFFQFGTMVAISKEELVDGSFLRRFKSSSYYYYDRNGKRKKYPYSFFNVFDAFIYSSKEKVIATFFDRRFESIKDENYQRLPCFDALVEHIWYQKNLLVFNMHIANVCTYFIVDEQSEISVFYEDRKDGIFKVVSVSEYLDAVGIDYLNARGARIRE